MKINVKQIFFVLTGLAIVTAFFLFMQHNNVEASKKNGKKFDDWVVQCSEGDKENKIPAICLLTQQINAQDKDKQTQQVLGLYQIGYFGEKKELKMIETLPLGIRVDAGTSIVSSKKLIAPGKFTSCSTGGCQAVAEISNDDLKTILNNKENTVVFMNLQGSAVALPFSTKGLEAGLKFIK